MSISAFQNIDILALALPKKNRLTAKKDIDLVFKNGRTVKSSSLFMRFLNNGHPESISRFALIVPAKHVTLAVDRNRIKRTLSGEIMSSPFVLKQGLDVVVLISKKVFRKEFGGLVKELRELLSKI